MRPVAVGFDFDRTLGRDYSLERRAFGVLADQLGAPIDIGAEVERALIERVLLPFRRATVSMPQMLETFVASLPAPAQARGASGEELAERYRAICYSLVDSVQPVPGARDCIDALVAEGVKVGILTNGWSPLQEKKIAHALGRFPGPVLVSETIGAYKPSADAFASLERALGCAASELWYVGDNPQIDVDGARAYGVRGIWFDGDGDDYPADVPPPAVVIRSLGELPALVRGS